MDALKSKVAQAALAYVGKHTILGIGSGSTVNAFIEALKPLKHQFEGCVAASIQTEAKLREVGIPVLSLSSVDTLPLYIDGADEVNYLREAIKGGGAALAREKVLAYASQHWLCIVEERKLVKRLGAFPLPVEVLPMARSMIAREIIKLGGTPIYREGVVTDNQNHILDVHDLVIHEPIQLEIALKQLPGVVENGLFAKRPADTLLIATKQGIETK